MSCWSSAAPGCFPSPNGSTSSMTRRWREQDSNHRSLSRGSRFILRKLNCAEIDGRPKKFGGVSMVRIHLPPAGSQVRTAIDPPELPVAPRKQAQAPAASGSALIFRFRDTPISLRSAIPHFRSLGMANLFPGLRPRRSRVAPT